MVGVNNVKEYLRNSVATVYDSGVAQKLDKSAIKNQAIKDFSLKYGINISESESLFDKLVKSGEATETTHLVLEPVEIITYKYDNLFQTTDLEEASKKTRSIALELQEFNVPLDRDLIVDISNSLGFSKVNLQNLNTSFQEIPNYIKRYYFSTFIRGLQPYINEARIKGYTEKEFYQAWFNYNSGLPIPQPNAQLIPLTEEVKTEEQLIDDIVITYHPSLEDIKDLMINSFMKWAETKGVTAKDGKKYTNLKGYLKSRWVIKTALQSQQVSQESDGSYQLNSDETPKHTIKRKDIKINLDKDQKILTIWIKGWSVKI